MSSLFDRTLVKLRASVQKFSRQMGLVSREMGRFKRAYQFRFTGNTVSDKLLEARDYFDSQIQKPKPFKPLSSSAELYRMRDMMFRGVMQHGGRCQFEVHQYEYTASGLCFSVGDQIKLKHLTYQVTMMEVDTLKRRVHFRLEWVQ